jgi:hypothetical protein
MLLIHDRIERKRLNGYREPGELYLVGTLPKFQCCKLPIELEFNLRPKAGLVPIPAHEVNLFRSDFCDENKCPGLSDSFAGMHWVSEKYYQGAAFFFQEARTLPIQIKIKRLHCGIEIGKSWIALAHRKAIVDYSKGCSGWVGEDGQAETDVQYKPGIFAMFRVDAIEYVMDTLALPPFPPTPYLDDMIASGITLVNVIHDEDLKSDSLEDETEITQGYE